jgi:hypothetical protein
MTKLESQLLALSSANIQLVPADMSTHYVLERDGFVCLVEKRDGGFGAIGSVCQLAGDGFAVVTWNGTEAHFVAKGQPRRLASPEEIRQFRAFSQDLRAALQNAETAG